MHEMSEQSDTQECGDVWWQFKITLWIGFRGWHLHMVRMGILVCSYKLQHHPDNRAALAICSPSISLAGVYLCTLPASVRERVCSTQPSTLCGIPNKAADFALLIPLRPSPRTRQQ